MSQDATGWESSPVLFLSLPRQKLTVGCFNIPAVLRVLWWSHLVGRWGDLWKGNPQGVNGGEGTLCKTDSQSPWVAIQGKSFPTWVQETGCLPSSFLAWRSSVVSFSEGFHFVSRILSTCMMQQRWKPLRRALLREMKMLVQSEFPLRLSYHSWLMSGHRCFFISHPSFGSRRWETWRKRIWNRIRICRHKRYLLFMPSVTYS